MLPNQQIYVLTADHQVSKHCAVICNKASTQVVDQEEDCPHFDFITRVHEVLQKTTRETERPAPGDAQGVLSRCVGVFIPGASEERLHTLQGTRNYSRDLPASPRCLQDLHFGALKA